MVALPVGEDGDEDEPDAQDGDATAVADDGAASLPSHLFNQKPMSGLFAFFLALQLCKGGVDLYGFEAWTGEGKYHYFDTEEGFQTRHSFDLALEVFKQVSHRVRAVRTVRVHGHDD